MNDLLVNENQFADVFINNNVELVEKNQYGFIETNCEFVKSMLIGIAYNTLQYSFLLGSDKTENINILVEKLYYG